MTARAKVVAGLVIGLVTAGCVAGERVDVAGLTLPDGFTSTLVIDDLNGPTQVATGADGTVFVAQLNGDEGGSTGQVVAIGRDGQSREVLYGGLDKPTGVAVVGDQLYVMERNRLSVGTIDGERLDVIVDDLPSNGRSEGSLSVAPDSALFYTTSGALREGDVVVESGVVWRLLPGEAPTEYATGFKNAYSHTFHESDVFVAEISDGTFDGTPAADEIVAINQGDDGGWPACVGNHRPVVEYGGDEASCQTKAETVALFDPGATPTSIVVAPWDQDLLVAALWNQGHVVAVSHIDERPATAETIVEGIEHPQDLHVVNDAIWLTDFDDGRIVEIKPT